MTVHPLHTLYALNALTSASTATGPAGPATATPVGTTPPRVAPRYRVLIHNDDVTPMGFVVLVLTRFFKKEDAEACEIMYEAHHKKVALVDVMGLEEAEFRVDQAHSLARTAKFPLTFTIEPE